VSKFESGHKKAGGRVAGTPNKRSTLFDEVNEKHPNFNPLIALIDLAQKTKSESIKVICFKELVKYYVPQLKSIQSEIIETQLPQVIMVRYPDDTTEDAIKNLKKSPNNIQ
jgi:hypothetical protein